MNADAIVASPVGRMLLDRLFSDGWRTPAALAGLGEAELYRKAIESAISVSEEGIEAALHPGAAVDRPGRAPAGAVERLAHALASAHATRRWSAGWDGRPQVWLTKGLQPPRPTYAPDPVSGKPPALLWTSSALPGNAGGWWPIVESGLLGVPQPWSAWRVGLSPDARVFEIRSPSDWRWLCDRFPGRRRRGHPLRPPHSAGRLVDPDWSAVDEEFDGVHLTVEGLVCAQGVPLERDGQLSMLWGWDAESTAWLRWRVESTTLLGTIHLPGEGG